MIESMSIFFYYAQLLTTWAIIICGTTSILLLCCMLFSEMISRIMSHFRGYSAFIDYLFHRTDFFKYLDNRKHAD